MSYYCSGRFCGFMFIIHAKSEFSNSQSTMTGNTLFPDGGVVYF